MTTSTNLLSACVHTFDAPYTCLHTQNKNVNYRQQNNKTKEQQGFCVKFLFGNYVPQEKHAFKYIQVYKLNVVR